jgi:tetratricopeptide (TPR) repeat protein
VKVPIAPRDATRAAPATKEQGSPIEIADSFLERGDTLLALQRYEQALARDAKDPKALFGKGRALHALGRYQEALRAFAAAVVAAPGVEEYARWRKMCEDRVRKEGRA